MTRIFPWAACLVLAMTITATAQAQGQRRTGTITTAAPVRLYPDPTRQPLTTLPVGTTIRVLGRERDWLNIEFEDRFFGRRVGYVLAAHVTVVRSQPTEPARPVAVESAVPETTQPSTTASSTPKAVPARAVAVEPAVREATQPSATATTAPNAVPAQPVGVEPAVAAATQPPATATSTPDAASQEVQIPDGPTGKHAPSVVVEYDRFKNTTSAVLTEISVGSGLAVGAMMTASGNDIKRAQSATLVIHSSNKEWSYLRCHDVAFIVDGERWPELASEHTGRVTISGAAGYSNVGVEERVTVPLTIEQFVKLGTAKKVEGRLCRREFTFDAEELIAFRHLASRLKK